VLPFTVNYPFTTTELPKYEALATPIPPSTRISPEVAFVAASPFAVLTYPEKVAKPETLSAPPK
jgi:hypothetical protein